MVGIWLSTLVLLVIDLVLQPPFFPQEYHLPGANEGKGSKRLQINFNALKEEI